MARTGLRMMPTFPSPSLKFRTAGFPRYGFKASISDEAFLTDSEVKPAPGMPSSSVSLSHPSRDSAPGCPSGSASRDTRISSRRCLRGTYSSRPQGSLAPVRVVLSRSILAYSDPIRQSRRHAAISRCHHLYAAPSLCGSAEATRETFPTFAAALSSRAANPTPVSPRNPLVAWPRGSRLPPIITESPLTTPVSASNTRRASPFRRCIVRFMLRPVRLPSPPDWLRQDEAICPSPRLLRYLVTPAFGPTRRRVTLGVRLERRTRNLLSSGLSPDKSQQLVRLHN